MNKHLAFTLLLMFIGVSLPGQTEYLPKKRYKTFRVETAPVINGAFDDPAWQQGTWVGGFVQHEPYADRPPSQETTFKVAYDDLNLYVVIRALDTSPDSITSDQMRTTWSLIPPGHGGAG